MMKGHTRGKGHIFPHQIFKFLPSDVFQRIGESNLKSTTVDKLHSQETVKTISTTKTGRFLLQARGQDSFGTGATVDWKTLNTQRQRKGEATHTTTYMTCDKV